MKLFAKRAQFNLAQALEERYGRVNRQYSTKRMESASNPSPFGNNTEANAEKADKFIVQRLKNERDVYTDFWTQRLRPDQSSNPTTIPDPGLDGRMTSLIRIAPWLATWFNETSVEMAGLTPGKAADGSWVSRVPVDENNLWRRQLPRDDNIILQSRLPEVNDIYISTQLERFGRKWQLAWLWMALGFGIIISVLFWVTRFVVRRVFLLDLTENPYLPTRSTDEIKENVFLVQTSPFATLNGATNGHANSQPCYIDLSTEASRDEWLRRLEAKAAGAETPSAVVVDHFEFRMNDRAHNDQKLRLIKTLLAAKKSVLIKSSHLPSTFSFTGAARDALKRHPNQSSDSWAEIMTRFRRVYEAQTNEKILQDAITRLSNSLEHPSISKQRKDRALRVAELIKNECAGAAWLANIGKEFIESLATEELESNYIFGQLMDRVELSYHKLWNNCSNDEKLTLLHLAEDRILSYRDPDIRHLMQRGLIVCAPDIRLINETFSAFVLSQCLLDIDESAEIQSAETKARKASSLTSFQIPVLIGFVAVVVFLLLTQKDLFSSPLTLVTAATTSIPTAFKVLSLFQGGNPGQKIFNA